ncbi:hypothetical protein I5908_12770, partial [Listeria monocytogenes]|nr:hypothetical protein [Listeria monocytogenes]
MDEPTKAVIYQILSKTEEQNVVFGEDTNITLPVYTQLDDLGASVVFQPMFLLIGDLSFYHDIRINHQ